MRQLYLFKHFFIDIIFFSTYKITFTYILEVIIILHSRLYDVLIYIQSWAIPYVVQYCERRCDVWQYAKNGAEVQVYFSWKTNFCTRTHISGKSMSERERQVLTR